MNSLLQDNVILKNKDNEIYNSVIPKKQSLNIIKNNKINTFNKSRMRTQTNLDKNLNDQLRTHKKFKSDILSKLKKK